MHITRILPVRLLALTILLGVLGYSPAASRALPADIEWRAEVVNSGDVGGYSPLALDSNDYPHIVYPSSQDGVDFLRYLWRDAAGWHSANINTPGYIGDVSLALDANGYGRISFSGFSGWGYNPLQYAWQNASGWHIEVVDQDVAVVFAPSLVLDSSGYAHVSYCASDESDNYSLKYAWQDAGGWHLTTVDNTGQVGLFNSLALDGNGYAHISYLDDSNHDLKYAWQDAGGWHLTTVDGDGNVGAHTSLALDHDGYAHISYCSFGSEWYYEHDLMYAWQDAGGWYTATLDYVNVGAYTSLALDQDDYAHISYQLTVGDDLKYTWQNTDGWHTTTVDSSGGGYSSLELDNRGMPHVTYQTDVGLKYAHAGYFLHLPLIGKSFLPCFSGAFEVEPNNAYLQSTGPLCSGQTVSGYPDDQKDYYSVYLPAGGTLTIDLANHTGSGVQLQLFYQVADADHRVGFDYTSPYRIVYTGQAGWYYIYIYTESGFNTATPYTLHVTYP